MPVIKEGEEANKIDPGVKNKWRWKWLAERDSVRAKNFALGAERLRTSAKRTVLCAPLPPPLSLSLSRPVLSPRVSNRPESGSFL